MELFIISLDEKMIDKFICQEADLYARIIRPAALNDSTVDLLIKVRTVAVDNNKIIIEFPNGAGLVVNMSNIHYHKIEVL